MTQSHSVEPDQPSQTPIHSRTGLILLGLFLGLAPILITAVSLPVLMFFHTSLFQTVQILLWVFGVGLGIAFVLILFFFSTRSRGAVAVSSLPLFIISVVIFAVALVMTNLFSSIYTQFTQPLYAQYHTFQMQTGQTATDDPTHLSLTVLSIHKIYTSDSTYVIVHVIVKNDHPGDFLLDSSDFYVERDYNHETASFFNKGIPGYKGHLIFQTEDGLLNMAAGKTVEGDLTFAFPTYYGEPQTLKWVPTDQNNFYDHYLWPIN